MQQLVGAAKAALAEQESSSRDLVQRDLAAQALRLLGQHEAQLARAYPLALLEAFADGPAQPQQSGQPQTQPQAGPGQDSGIDFGELSLVDEADVLAQLELARAQQAAIHATEAALSELNALVSSAQGLASVQPERNPLRPENYIRALQQVIAELGVAAEVRQLWMTHMRDLLGQQLVGAYQRAARQLREQGVEPVGYAVAAIAGAVRFVGGAALPATSSFAGMETAAHTLASGLGSHYGAPVTGASAWGGMSSGAPLDMHTQEALLTVGLLQQMLATGGDPHAWSGSTAAAPIQSHPGQPGGQVQQDAAEAMQDLAQLEQLVGRLAGSGVSAHGQAAVSRSAALPAAPGAELDAAAGVVSRMMDNIALDSRLLPAMQRAVQELAPALRQLVRHDTGFFSDEQHPARRLLDELTQRSLAFQSEDEPGFSRFMRLVDEAVLYLAGASIESAKPFERVLRALDKAWETQERRQREYQEQRQRARQQRERRALLAERAAADFRRLPAASRAFAQMLAFVTGPWAQVVALAQSEDDADAAQGYLDLAPVLLTMGGPVPADADGLALAAAIGQALPLLERGLASIAHPADSTAQIMQLLRDWQARLQEHAQAGQETQQEAQQTPEQAAQELPPPEPPAAAQTLQPSAVADEPQSVSPDERAEAVPSESAAPLPESSPSAALAPLPASAPDRTSTEAIPASKDQQSASAPELSLGLWFEIGSPQAGVRRQLTWTSPNRTLFLFTSADGSTQSMTRRMIDRLAAEGRFRALPAG